MTMSLSYRITLNTANKLTTILIAAVILNVIRKTVQRSCALLPNHLQPKRRVGLSRGVRNVTLVPHGHDVLDALILAISERNTKICAREAAKKQTRHC